MSKLKKYKVEVEERAGVFGRTIVYVEATCEKHAKQILWDNKVESIVFPLPLQHEATLYGGDTAIVFSQRNKIWHHEFGDIIDIKPVKEEDDGGQKK